MLNSTVRGKGVEPDLNIELWPFDPAGTGLRATNFDNVRLDATAVPEPSTGLLLGSALVGLAASRRMRRR